jgi:predicted enzyme related to lactoylglutathione lyase
MARVTGIGGIFFKSGTPDELSNWYERHLGIKRTPDGSAVFEWLEAADATTKAMTVWSIFPRDTNYFGNGPQNCMINYRVDNLDELLEQLKQTGVIIDPHREDYDYGRFAWIVDPDGNRVELWEPTKE